MVKNEEIEQAKTDLVLRHFESPEELRDWVWLYLDLYMPMGHMSDEANSSSVESMWEIYKAVKDNTGDKIPGYTLLSSRDSYKCQAKGSKILSKRGLVNIEDILIGDEVWTGWNWQKVSNWIDDGKKDGIVVTTQKGLKFTGSPIHRYWCLRNGQEQWIESKDLNPSTDLICVNTDVPSNFDIDKDSYDLGYFLGILIGDGSLSFLDYEKGASFFALTTVDPYILQFFFDFCQKKWNYTPKKSSDGITYRVASTAAVKFLKECGVKNSLSYQKTIPNCVWSNKSTALGFINGVFDTDGSFDKSKKNVLFSMSAETLLREMQTLLLSFGIVSSFRKAKKIPILKNKKLKQNHLTCILTINAHEMTKFVKIGFVNKSKKANALQAPLIPDAHNTIPWSQLEYIKEILKISRFSNIRNRKYKSPVSYYDTTIYKGVNVDKLQKLTLWLEENLEKEYYKPEHRPKVLESVCKLKSLLKNNWQSFALEKVENVHFYDLTVEHDHSYWSNGSISHNTLSASILEVILLIHFRCTIAHCAAIVSQSQKSVEYINNFMTKVMPYLSAKGWKRSTQNKMRIELLTDKNEMCYIQVIVLTMKGANCISLKSTIVTEKGIVLAENVKAGDKILTWNYIEDKDCWVEVGSTETTNKSSREVVFEDGTNLVLSDDHMVLTQRGWVPACNLRLTDKLKPTEFGAANCGYEKTELSTFSRELDQLILGTVLGDACILTTTGGKNRYSVFHCKEQLEYLQEIKKVFDLNNIPCEIRPNKDGYKLLTKTHPIFDKYRQLFYENNVKTPKNVLSLLSYEGIAYWFMDDARGNGKAIGKRKDHRFELAACGFTLEENQQIVDFFVKKGYDCTVRSVSNGFKKYPLIVFELDSSRDLSERMEIYFVNCLKYKLLPPKDLVSITRTIDEDELVKVSKGFYGFVWSDKDKMRKSPARKWSKKIKQNFTKKIKQINIIGRQMLIDLKINTPAPYLHSFYANGTLVHNSAHTNLLFVDEVDLVQPQAYQEAKMIPGVARGRFPLTIRLSTRKFAFGLMEQEIQKAPITNEKVIRWNILDVTEYCPPSRCLPDQPKTTRYIRRELPLGQITEAEYNALEAKEKDKYESVEAYQGCLSCPLLSVCKTKLHTHKDPSMVGDLWKPIPAVINVIRQVNPDVGEAQLLCHKPSTAGLIYPRFSNLHNVVSVQQAWEMISGSNSACSFEQLVHFIKNLGVPIEAGVDWGFTHQFAIIVGARLTNGTCLILDKFAAPGLELSDCIRIGKDLKTKYGIQRFWCDTAYPAYVKSYNKEGLTAPHFDKDVARGITAVREKIIDGGGARKFFILDTDNNASLIQGTMTYHWKLDSAGNPTDKPDHTEEADEMDALRYLVENMFGFKNKVVFASAEGKGHTRPTNNSEIMAQKLDELTEGKAAETKPRTGRKILWM